jgi:hypothetical protein
VKHTQQRFRKARRGYTIAEVMIAMTICTFVMYGLYQFTLQTSHLMFDSVQRIDVDAGMRHFSENLENDMQTASAFYLYTSFNTTDRNATDGSQRLAADANGDFLLLIYTQPWPNSNSTVYITKLIGYYRKTTNVATWGTVNRFEVDYDTANLTTLPVAANNPVESVIASLAYTNTYPQILSAAKGLYSNHIFYNQNNTSIMTGLEIYRGNVGRNTTEMMYLTVSPR